MTPVSRVEFEAKWKEQLVCSMDGKRFVLELTMGVLGAYFPTKAKWEESVPAWAKPHWERVRSDLADWCEDEGIPLHIQDDAWADFS
jgi:hypothetical protein